MEAAVEGGGQQSQREEDRKQRYFEKEEEDEHKDKEKKKRKKKKKKEDQYKKRKEDDVNETNLQPNKFQRTNSSSHVHEEHFLANFKDDAAATQVTDKLKEATQLKDYAYLDLIYVIPKVDERLKEDGLDWLLSNCKMPREPRPKVADEEVSQVWDKPIRIESLDVIAMPYVTPY